VLKISIYWDLQWAVYIATDVDTGVYKGAPGVQQIIS